MRLAAGFAALGLLGCAGFSRDVTFLKRYTDVVVLEDGPARVAVCPAYQGRVMTSTAGGPYGTSYGWINYDLIASGKTQRHINVYGGEDRFWLGPEGGQFSIFFAKGAPFDLEHWFTPAPLDTEPFDVARKSSDRIVLRKRMNLANSAGTVFDLDVSREIRLLEASEVWRGLGMDTIGTLRLVGFESLNRITNAGKDEWTKEKGLLSIWILGMFKPSDATTVVVPVRPGPGPAVNDRYFGPVPAGRLALKGDAVFFKGDGLHRSKIGVGPARARPVLGSYDAGRGLLTLVQFTFKEGVTDYVNSMWELQKEPYGGDVANSYNDGPAAPGAAPLGPFYELESSSPAAALRPGQSLTHSHRTVHLEGPREDLDRVARKMLGVGLDEIEQALPR